MFRSTCTSWQQYQPGVNDLTITHVRKYALFLTESVFLWRRWLTRYSYDLPDDVFQAGETKPSRPKKKVTKKVPSTGQKRSIEDVEVSNCVRVVANAIVAALGLRVECGEGFSIRKYCLVIR